VAHLAHRSRIDENSSSEHNVWLIAKTFTHRKQKVQQRMDTLQYIIRIHDRRRILIIVSIEDEML
jgi:hypothetical protein